MGINCARAAIARFRTTGRECDNRGASTAIGGGLISSLERYSGNRVIRIISTERISTRVSGAIVVLKHVRHVHGALSVIHTFCNSPRS